MCPTHGVVTTEVTASCVECAAFLTPFPERLVSLNLTPLGEALRAGGFTPLPHKQVALPGAVYQKDVLWYQLLSLWLLSVSPPSF